jgi:hypothetical protein
MTSIVSGLWHFYLLDEDRSTGWTNHGYVLQYVCSGEGETPEQAWESAKRGDAGPVPKDFVLPATLIAIREADEYEVGAA